MVKDSSFITDVAAEMDSVMSSDDFKSIFSKPGQVVKTASKKEECKEDHEHTKDCMEAADANDGNIEASAGNAVEVLISISEALDEMGFDKSASVAIIAAETLISEAKKKAPKKDKKDDKKKGKFPFFMKKDKKDKKEEDKEDGEKEEKKK